MDPVHGGYTCFGPCGSPNPWDEGFDEKQDQTIHNGGSKFSQEATSGGRRSGGNAKEAQARRQVQQAEQQQAETKRKMVHAAKQLGKILMDELGITAGLDCFTRGDIGACAETALNVLMSSVGGFAGKIIGKYALRWKKAAALAKSVWKLGDELIDGIKGFFKTSDDLKAARRQLAETCNSFDGATRVRMADGSSKPIRQVKVGDRVLATDPVTGRTAGKVVTRLIVGSGVKKLVAVTVQTRDGKKSIVATDGHPFWTVNDQRWTDAADLKRGDALADAGGRKSAVTDTKRFIFAQTAYNLTVADTHTYYVMAGNVPVLVHNCGLGDFAASQREVPGTKFASEYTSPSGQKYYSTNRHGTAGELENMPELRDAVSAAGHHGGCAEVGCLIQAYKAEGPSAISGGTMRTVNVRNPMSSRAAEQGTPAYPCARCQRLLDGLGLGVG